MGGKNPGCLRLPGAEFSQLMWDAEVQGAGAWRGKRYFGLGDWVRRR